MTRRPAVTLIEVLVTLFIMAIGLLALLTLFPLGAITMGQALKDDRCASTAAMAENVAVVYGLRDDFFLLETLAFGPPGNPAYVDPYGVAQFLPPLGGVIPRIQPSFLFSYYYGTPTTLYIDRLFSLPDDVTFQGNGTPDLSSGVVQRGLNYSYTYLVRPLRKPSFTYGFQISSEPMLQLFVVVFSGRPVTTLSPEPTYSAAGTAGTNGLTLTWPAGQPTPNVKRGSWLLDTTTDQNGAAQGLFYRVTNLVDTSPTSMVVELERNLVANVNAVTVMDNVAEVFDKGTSWRP
jgi:hypothetical protein